MRRSGSTASQRQSGRTVRQSGSTVGQRQSGRTVRRSGSTASQRQSGRTVRQRQRGSTAGRAWSSGGTRGEVASGSPASRGEPELAAPGPRRRADRRAGGVVVARHLHPEDRGRRGGPSARAEIRSVRPLRRGLIGRGGHAASRPEGRRAGV